MPPRKPNGQGKRSIMDGLTGSPLETLEKPDNDPNSLEVEIQNSTYIGSYNWTEGNRTIIVPGSPRIYNGITAPFSVTPDRGMHFMDQNNYRMGDKKLVPLVLAVNEMTPDFSWPTVDIVTDRNNLRKLLRWVQGQKKAFRIDLQLVGERTLLMRRWDPFDRERFDGHSYGFSFEKKITRPAQGCEEGTAHHRIITYDLNGLKMVVRFEVDARLSIQVAQSSNDNPSTSVDVHSQQLASMTVQSGSRRKKTVHHHGMTILSNGEIVLADSIAEVETRRATGQGKGWVERFLQIYLSQTPYHILGKHTDGVFHELEQRHISSPQFAAAKEKESANLKKLRHILGEIQTLAITLGPEARPSLVLKGGRMVVYERARKASFLPIPLLERFA